MNVDETDAKIVAWLDAMPVGRPATPHEAARLADGEAYVAAMRELARWEHYLDGLPEDVASAAMVGHVHRVWRELQAKAGCRLRAPITVPAHDGYPLHIAWNAARTFLEVEVLEDGRVMWFYRDSAAGVTEGSDEPASGVDARLAELAAAVASADPRPVVRLMAVGPVATPCPRYARPGDAGMDLPVAVWSEDGTMVLPAGERVLLGTGWAFAIPAGYEGQVRPRSSANVRGIHVPLGTIDSGYRGEVRVVVENRTGAPLTLRSGDRVAQLVVAPVAHAAVEVVDALDATERGAGGFGSTG